MMRFFSFDVNVGFQHLLTISMQWSDDWKFLRDPALTLSRSMTTSSRYPAEKSKTARSKTKACGTQLQSIAENKCLLTTPSLLSSDTRIRYRAVSCPPATRPLVKIERL